MEGRFSVNPVWKIEVSPPTGVVNEDTLGNMPSTASNKFAAAGAGNAPNATGPKRKKSLIQLTREVLPRLEHYRLSKRVKKRPSLGELHGGDETTVSKEPNAGSPSNEQDVETNDLEPHLIKLGWIQGVFIPCLLNIFGVMLFLRLSWVVAEAGIGYSLLIIVISAIVCIITTLSLSAISTNGEVKGGGIYYIISRSLGPEFGASVGLVFAFANAVAASMNTIGFCNSLSDLLNRSGYTLIDGDVNDARAIGTVAIIIMVLICAVGMEWESKAQNFLVAIIVVAMLDFLVGVIVGPVTNEQIAQGFLGLNMSIFTSNWADNYRDLEGVSYDFFQVFAIFFPSVTGIQAGANISGDLKDPATAIPKGTFLALLISMISYAIFVLFAGASAIRDASGNVLDVVEGRNLSSCIPHCTHGLYNDFQMMTIMSGWGPLIYAGCFAATLSTALTNLLSVPRIIQALGMDRIYPGLIYFSKGYGRHGEPYRGYLLTLFISILFLLIGELNAIAPLISTFYLASYALINFCTFHAALIKPVGWRPTFKYYNTWLSLAGFIMCVVIMFLINWISSLITFSVILGLYLIVVYRKPDVNWGSSTQAQMYKAALTTAHKLNCIGDHVKNYKPQVLLLCGTPASRPALVDFANLITKNNSLLILGDIVEQRLSYRPRAEKIRNVYAWLNINKTKGFYTLLDNISFELGATALLQTTGVGKLAPNVLMMGYKNNWRTCNHKDLLAYFNVLHAAFDHRLSVAILRLHDGLDYGHLLVDEDSSPSSTATPNLSNHKSNSNSLIPTAANNIMRVDSNLSLSEMVMKGGACTERSETGPQMKSNSTTNSGQSQQRNDNVGVLLKSKKIASLNRLLSNSSTTSSESAIPKCIVDSLTVFKTKQTKGYIDVWWLYDDGGLTMLLPYIISLRQNWSTCKLRVFALSVNKFEMEVDKKNMENLLLKFRINYASLKIVSNADKPHNATIEFFDNLIKEFRRKSDFEDDECKISEGEVAALKDKTMRQLRLRELLLEHSSNANLIVMSMPMPRRDKLSALMYMAWLESLTKDLPPYLLVRGNQQSVLTFYS